MPRKQVERAIDQKIHTDKPLFLGWYDPDKKKSAGAKLAEACQRFTDKFGQEARYCLCSSADAEAIGGEHEGVQVSGRHYIAASVFYVGVNAA